MDLFLALTSDDEDNIMSCLLAKRMGAGGCFALINRKAYAELVQGTEIDIAISPSHTVIGELLAYVRRGDVEAVHSLRRGAAEALEGIVRGDHRTCKLAGRRLDEIGLPPGPQIGRWCAACTCPTAARPRTTQPLVIMAHHDTVIQPNDHVIVFIRRKRSIKAKWKSSSRSAPPSLDEALRCLLPFAVLGGVLMLFSLTLPCRWPLPGGMTTPADGLRRGLRHHAGLWRRAVLRLPQARLAARTAAARRLPAGDAGVGGAAGLRRAAADVLPARAELHRCLFRSRVGPDHHRRHGAHGAGQLPLSINVWRCFMVLLGGMGIIVLAVAILPLLGVGGSQVFKAETPGPDEGREAHAAHRRNGARLWGCTSPSPPPASSPTAWPAWAGPMPSCTCAPPWAWAASSYDASFGHFNSPAIEAVAIFFMLMAGVNFALYFLVWRGARWPPVARPGSAGLRAADAVCSVLGIARSS
jgi:Trk K+ transport system NAD-binding subunit